MRNLIKKAKRKNPDAFVELIEQQKQAMYKVAKSYLGSEADVADAIQETILSCYENLESLREERYFKTWLIRILINKCKNIRRVSKWEYPTDIIPEQGQESMALENYEFYELLQFLDEKYRTVLVLYYAEGFKIKEISQILDIDENTVKTRLSRGRKKFEERYILKPVEGGRYL